MCTIFRRGVSRSGPSSISFRVMKKAPGGARRRGRKIALRFHANYSSRRRFFRRRLRLLTCETERDHNLASLMFVPSLFTIFEQYTDSARLAPSDIQAI